MSLRVFRKRMGLIRSPALVPQHDLVRSDAEYDWQSVGDDPQFLLQSRFWLPGWYMLEISVIHDQATAISSIYLDYGTGFSEENRVDLPLKQELVSKRMVYLGPGLKRLRFDPMASSGSFTVRRFSLVWLRPKFARLKLHSKLTSHHPKYFSLSNTSLFRELDALAEDLGVSVNLAAAKEYEKLFQHSRAEINYRDWLQRKGDDKRCTDQSKLYFQPLISVLLPTFNSNLIFLKSCVESVLSQSYANWQLCIADDGSTSSELRNYLEGLTQIDDRIVVCFRDSNGHISAASNSALDFAEGEFVALLDHDDMLAADALCKVAEVLNQNEGVKFIYTDEDKVDETGERFAPHFKPDWNPDLLYAQNYICHLAVFQTSRLRNVGGFRSGVEGSQDHDLVLRFTHGLDVGEICHIPEVLYHWRATDGSTAARVDSKTYTQEAGLIALRDFFASESRVEEVSEGFVSNSYRVKWQCPEPKPLVSIIIPTRDKLEILKPCVESILSKTAYQDYELLILDNQSSCAETLSYLASLPDRDSRIRVLTWNHPFNYSAINNFGVTNAQGSVIALLNNDVEPINKDWLDEMVSQACRVDVGCVGAMLYYPDDTIQHAGVILGIGGVAGHSHKYYRRGSDGYHSRLKLVQNLSAVTGACLVVRKSVYEEVGGLDEENLPVAFNDVDFCLRVRELGYRNLWTPYAELYHHESISRGGDDTTAKKKRAQAEVDYMRSRWLPVIKKDPSYNQNLSSIFEDFSLEVRSVL